MTIPASALESMRDSNLFLAEPMLDRGASGHTYSRWKVLALLSLLMNLVFVVLLCLAVSIIQGRQDLSMQNPATNMLTQPVRSMRLSKPWPLKPPPSGQRMVKVHQTFPKSSKPFTEEDMERQIEKIQREDAEAIEKGIGFTLPPWPRQGGDAVTREPMSDRLTKTILHGGISNHDKLDEFLRNPKVVILDTRPEDWLDEPEEHPMIDGAVHAWVEFGHARWAEELEKAIEDGRIPADKNTPIITYCTFGGRAELALVFLDEKGYKNLCNGIGDEEIREAMGLIKAGKKRVPKQTTPPPAAPPGEFIFGETKEKPEMTPPKADELPSRFGPAVASASPENTPAPAPMFDLPVDKIRATPPPGAIKDEDDLSAPDLDLLNQRLSAPTPAPMPYFPKTKVRPTPPPGSVKDGDESFNIDYGSESELPPEASEIPNMQNILDGLKDLPPVPNSEKAGTKGKSLDDLTGTKGKKPGGASKPPAVPPPTPSAMSAPTPAPTPAPPS